MKQTASNHNFKIKKLQFKAYDFFRIGLLLVILAFIGIGIISAFELSTNMANWISCFVVGWMFFGVSFLILSFSCLSLSAIMQKSLKEQVKEMKSFKLYKEKKETPRI